MSSAKNFKDTSLWDFFNILIVLPIAITFFWDQKKTLVTLYFFLLLLLLILLLLLFNLYLTRKKDSLRLKISFIWVSWSKWATIQSVHHKFTQHKETKKHLKQLHIESSSIWPNNCFKMIQRQQFFYLNFYWRRFSQTELHT